MFEVVDSVEPVPGRGETMRGRRVQSLLEVGIPCRCLLGEAHTSKGGRAGGRLS